MNSRTPVGAIAALVTVAILGIVGLIVLAGSLTSTPADKIGLVYGGGPLDKKSYVRTVNPGSGLTNIGAFNNIYLYPTTQRTFIVDANGGGDSAVAISTVTKDKITVDWNANTYFQLNLEKLPKFQQKIGFKYASWTTSGWNKMLAETFKPQVASALQTASRKYTVAELYANQDAIITIQEEVAADLAENINEALGDDYFCGPGSGEGKCTDFQFVIPTKPVIPDSVKTAFGDNQVSEIAVQTAANQVDTKRQEAEGIRILANATRDAGAAYLEMKRIEAQKIAAEHGSIFYVPYGSNIMVNPGK